MGALEPKFIDSFDVWTGNYGDFIGEKVRPDVINYCHDFIGFDVLPPEVTEQPPRLWFHIVLRTETSSLTLAIRMDNLYLVGFMNSAGWWEFNNDNKTHLIRDSTWLGFSGSYLDLIGKKGKLEDVTLGRGQMSYAVDGLAKYPTEMILEEEEEEEDPYAKPKSALVKLVIMLCEGMRFFTVSGTVDNMFKNRKDGKIEPTEAIQVKNWDNISKAVLTNDFTHVKDIVENRDTAKEIIALIKNQTSNGENKNEL